MAFLIALILTTNSGNAAVGGPTQTFTVLSDPGSLNPGDTVTINSTTTTQGGGTPALGDVTFLKISDLMTLGPVSDGSTTSATLPVVKFTPYEDFTTLAIGLPVSNITNIGALYISWQIFDDLNGSSLIEGQINKNSVEKMITEENLLITIGTFQTDPVNWSTGFDLTAGVDYFLKLDGLNANFEIKTSNIPSSAVSLSDDVTELFENPQITLYGGQNLGRTPIDAGGNASMEFSVASGDKYVIAEFGDLFFSSPSYDIMALNVTSPEPEPEKIGTEISYTAKYNQALDNLQYEIAITSNSTPVLDGIVSWSVLDAQNKTVMSGYTLVNDVNETIYIPREFNGTNNLILSYLDVTGTYENKEILIDIFVLFDEIPEEEETTNEGGNIDIDPSDVVIISPPTTENDNQNDIIIGNETTIPGDNSNNGEIPEPDSDLISEVKNYLDLIAIAGLQGGSKLKKLKKF